jgi:hypothetical protein
MLNEIHDIAQALEEAKVVLRTTSVLLRPHSRSPVVECWIDSKGGVSKIELKEQCQGPGKIKPNNHASFPAVALSIVPLAGSQPKDLSILRGLVVEGVSSPNLFRKGLEKSIKSYRKALGYLAPDSELERFARSVTAIDLDLWLARIVEELPGCIKDLSEDLLKKVGKHFFPGGGLQLMVFLACQGFRPPFLHQITASVVASTCTAAEGTRMACSAFLCRSIPCLFRLFHGLEIFGRFIATENLR